MPEVASYTNVSPLALPATTKSPEGVTPNSEGSQPGVQPGTLIATARSHVVVSHTNSRPSEDLVATRWLGSQRMQSTAAECAPSLSAFFSTVASCGA